MPNSQGSSGQEKCPFQIGHEYTRHDIYEIMEVPEKKRRQFTLAGVLSFMLAGSVYFSMMASVWPVLHYWRHERYDLYPSPPVWPAFTAIPTAWCVLWWLYRRWRLPQAMRVHYAGLMMATMLIVIASPFTVIGIAMSSQSGRSTLTSLGDALQAGAVVLLGGCGLSTAVSLPAASVMLLYLMLRPMAEEVS